MLKIKDNVNLKELEKFGLKPKYNEDTGKIKMFESFRYQGMLHRTLFQTIFYEYKKGIYILDDTCTKDSPRNYRVDTELLYDLIKVGFVEKVGE